MLVAVKKWLHGVGAEKLGSVSKAGSSPKYESVELNAHSQLLNKSPGISVSYGN